MSNTAHRMAWKAAHLFRRFYGDYPTRIGLDIKTRYPEYANERGRYLMIIEPPPLVPMLSIEALTSPIVPELHMVRHEITIDPLVQYDRAAYELHGLHVAHPEPDMIWCQWGNTTVKMSLWFTENGYDCIIWDEGNNE